MTETKRVVVAMSGGVDSSVSAALLVEQGYDVSGIMLRLWAEPGQFDTARDNRCCTRDQMLDAHFVAKKLGIPFQVIDVQDTFKQKVVDNFISAYSKGVTPNPCLYCNRHVRFGPLLDQALKHGAAYLATGHYAIVNEEGYGKFHLYKGIDPKKDQSYFLARLTQHQLSNAIFPLGNMKKSDVIQLAKSKGFKPVKTSESQDVCFINSKNYGDFLVRHKGFEPKPGLIKDIRGNILGEHKGLHLFTIGQRRGINCPASEPYYVIHMDIQQNILTVGFKKDLSAYECTVKNINWIHEAPDQAISVHTRVRYRHTAAASRVIPVDDKTAMVIFEKPQEAITPGQCAVFYKKDEVLGGGWIAPIQNI